MEEDWSSANLSRNFLRQTKVLCVWSKCRYCVISLWGRYSAVINIWKFTQCSNTECSLSYRLVSLVPLDWANGCTTWYNLWRNQSLIWLLFPVSWTPMLKVNWANLGEFDATSSELSLATPKYCVTNTGRNLLYETYLVRFFSHWPWQNVYTCTMNAIKLLNYTYSRLYRVNFLT